MIYPDKRPDFTFDKNELVVMVNGTPLRSNKLPCPSKLLDDPGAVRIYRMEMEGEAIRRGELIMPFKDTLELSIPTFTMLTDPQVNASLRREIRLKQAVLKNCQEEPDILAVRRN